MAPWPKLNNKKALLYAALPIMRPWRSDVGTGPVAAFVATVSKVLGKNGSIRFLGKRAKQFEAP